MKIWVDADACPVAVKEILFKACKRTEIQLTLVANKFIKVPESKFINSVKVPLGQDVADNTILQNIEAGDLVITNDIPLASIAVEKGAVGINPRGEVYTIENASEKLSFRNFMDSLRSHGVETGGPPPLTKRDIQAFANTLDKLLSKHLK